MKRLLIIILLLLPTSILIGCASKSVVVQTETIRVYSPTEFVAPREEPAIPRMWYGMNRGEETQYFLEVIEIWREAWMLSEADKRKDREWRDRQGKGP